MAALCPSCRFQDTQALADKAQCMSCGLVFDVGTPVVSPPKKKAKK